MALKYPRELLSSVFRELSASAKDRRLVSNVVDVVFFASMTVVEGAMAQVAVVFHDDGAKGLALVHDGVDAIGGDEDRGLAWDVTPLAPMELDVEMLAKLSRGLEYGAQVVVISGSSNKLRVDGIARRRKSTDGGDVVRIAAPRPGVIVFERGHEEILRFEAGQRVSPALNVLGEDGPIRNALREIIGEQDAAFSEIALRDLIRRMRATGSGALLAFYPAKPKDSVLRAMKIRRVETGVLSERVKDAANKRIDAIFAEADEKQSGRERANRRHASDDAQERLDAAIDDVARMSAIDGAVVGGPKLAIYGAGVVLESGDHGEVVRAVDSAMKKTARYEAHIRGARHRAAFYFAAANPGGVAFVMSEDGPVSCAIHHDGRVVMASVHVSNT